MLIDPPDHCQLCGADIQDDVVDGATRFGPWAWMCVDCHHQNGYGLGTGKGQLYHKDQGTWKKTGG